MTLSRWKKIKSREEHINPFWTYKVDEFEIPTTGFRGKYYYVHTHGSSMVIPITSSGELILVKQYRYLNKRFSLEFPCGGMKTGENPEKTAQTELREETGFSAEKFLPMGKFCPFNGVTDEYCHLYIASGLNRQPKKPDETEEFSIETVSYEQMDKMCSSGKIFDGMTLAAWAIAGSKVKEYLSEL
ncbi:MAG: NUDIX hydrolase [Ignavibacteriales bacterium]|jgi:NTP pyrophosphohydrolases including oxidative damage repair enzymes|nr:MAG: NUDIX hydrolase [Ignavibacteriaceae bacterium]MBW7871965.1 NUDIX hydrolase [Ignavibacteria bacterium]MCZ2144377.1 NUDIX hydrolase [Ignavibacteriales bacterium]OQY75561.1 MAG: hypothetical protein B6D45_05530 [Ignavibacteriales bacterium UTCHB3]MBV6446138.1 ADP-ribose pyrophosphatase [Ignavibacteriaceae bacterium]